MAKVFDESDTTYAAQRAELHQLLSPVEYRAARKNTLNAHYTAAGIVEAMWQAVTDLGLSEGDVLEPGSGAGNFIGRAPEGISMTGVEVEPVTAAISKLLYPNADIYHESFARSPFRAEVFDGVVGNVPFGAYPLRDPEHNPGRRDSIHNHFIAKAMAFTRPGGVMAVVTSSWTLDAATSSWRERMFQHSDLLGAVRLPGSAHRAVAGTDVVTDILLLRKRLPGVEPGDATWLQVSPAVHPDGSPVLGISRRESPPEQYNINNYFTAHSEHVLGTISDGGYGGIRVNPDPQTPVGAPLDAALSEHLRLITQAAHTAGRTWSPQPAVIGDRADVKLASPADTAPSPEPEATGDLSQGLVRSKRAAGNTREGRIEFAGEQYAPMGHGQTQPKLIFTQITNGFEVELPVPPRQAPELRHLLQLRDLVTSLLEQESESSDDDYGLQATRASLKDTYEHYVREYGPITRHTLTPSRKTGGQPTRRRPPQGGFRTDESSIYVLALEKSYDPASNTAVPADIFTTRQIDRDRVVAEHASDPLAAIALAAERGEDPSIDTLARIMQLPVDQARKQLAGHVFLAPDGTSVPRAQYLSGNVRIKLREAQAAAQTDPAFAANVEALSAVLPPTATIADVPLTLGASWIAPDLVARFGRRMMGSDDNQLRVKFDGRTWSIQTPKSNKGRSPVLEYQTWGTEARSFYDLLERILRNQHHVIKVVYKNPDGTTTVDEEASAAATDKAAEIVDEFVDWVWSEPEVAEQICAQYTEHFRSLVPRSYDDAPARTLPGMTPHITLLPHQNAGVSRALGEPSVLFDHVVGAGKTFTLVATAMELKRLGLVNKPVLAVPNPLMGQWVREVRELYPGARVLAADSEALTKNGRQAFAARATSSDWDLVLMTHESFESIPVDEAWAYEYLSREVDFLEKQKQAAIAGDEDDRTIKQIERDLAKAHESITDQIERRKDDGGINFARLGFDYVMADEAHVYKNLSFFTTSQAISSPEGSGRARDMHMKLEYLRSSKRGQASPRIAAFATGTPISNSLAEMYTFTRFLRPDLLDEHGVASFDEWAATFARASAKLEVNTAASGYTSKVRMRGFSEALGDGLRIWRTFTDTKTADMLNLPRPTLKGGSRTHHVVQPSEGQEIVLASFLRRYENKPVGRARLEKGADNDVAIIGDGRANAISPRMVSDRGLSWAGLDRDDSSLTSPKLERMADEIAAIYHRMKDTRYRVKAEDDSADWSPIPGALQMVMMDSGTPKKTGEWSGYAELKQQIADRGVPAGQIEWIQDYKGPERRGELFDRARNGQVAVLMGSTGALGTGTNVQNRLYALHHADGSWKPADIEQREGRVLRRGNQNPEIEIHVYLTQRTHDEKTWDMTAYKQRGLNAIAHGDYSMRGMEFEDDSDPLTDFDTLVGMASGDPLVMDQRTLDADLRKLERTERAWSRQRAYASSTANIHRNQIRRTQASIDILTQAQQQRIDTTGDAFTMTVPVRDATGQGTTLTTRKDAAEVLAQLIQPIFEKGRFGIQEWPAGTIAEIAGFTVKAATNTTDKGAKAVVLRLAVQGTALPLDTVEVYLSDLKQNMPGVITRLETRARSIDDRIIRRERDIERLTDEIKRVEETLAKPFRNATALRSIRERKTLVDTILDEDQTTDEAGAELDKQALRAEYARMTEEYRQSESTNREQHADSVPESLPAQQLPLDGPPAPPADTLASAAASHEPSSPAPRMPFEGTAPAPEKNDVPSHQTSMPLSALPNDEPDTHENQSAENAPVAPVEQDDSPNEDPPFSHDPGEVIWDDTYGEVSREQLQAYQDHAVSLADHQQLEDDLHPFNRNGITRAVLNPENHTPAGQFSLSLFHLNQDNELPPDEPAIPQSASDPAEDAPRTSGPESLSTNDQFIESSAGSDVLFSLDEPQDPADSQDPTSAPAASRGMPRLPEPAGDYEGPWTPTRIMSKATNFAQVIAAHQRAGATVQTAGYTLLSGGIEIFDPQRARYTLDQQKVALDAGPNTSERSQQLAYLTRMQDRIGAEQHRQAREAEQTTDPETEHAEQPEHPRNPQDLARLLNEQGRPRDQEFEQLEAEHRLALADYFQDQGTQATATYQAARDLIDVQPHVPDGENALRCDAAANAFTERAAESQRRGWPKLAAYHRALAEDARIQAQAWRDGVMVFGAGYTVRPERNAPGLTALDDGVTLADREGVYDNGTDQALWDRVEPLAVDVYGQHLTSEVTHLRTRTAEGRPVTQEEWQRAFTQTLRHIHREQYRILTQIDAQNAKPLPKEEKAEFRTRAVQFGQHLYDLTRHIEAMGYSIPEEDHSELPNITNPQQASNADFLDAYGAYTEWPTQARYNLLRSLQFGPDVPTDPGWVATLDTFKHRTWTETCEQLPTSGLRETITTAPAGEPGNPAPQTPAPTADIAPSTAVDGDDDAQPPQPEQDPSPLPPAGPVPPSLLHRAWQEIYEDLEAAEQLLERAQADADETIAAQAEHDSTSLIREFQAHEQAMFEVSGPALNLLQDLRNEAALTFHQQNLAVPITQSMEEAAGPADVPATWIRIATIWQKAHPDDTQTITTLRSYARRAADIIETDRPHGHLPDGWTPTRTPSSHPIGEGTETERPGLEPFQDGPDVPQATSSGLSVFLHLRARHDADKPEGHRRWLEALIARADTLEEQVPDFQAHGFPRYGAYLHRFADDLRTRAHLEEHGRTDAREVHQTPGPQDLDDGLTRADQLRYWDDGTALGTYRRWHANYEGASVSGDLFTAVEALARRAHRGEDVPAEELAEARLKTIARIRQHADQYVLGTKMGQARTDQERAHWTQTAADLHALADLLQREYQTTPTVTMLEEPPPRQFTQADLASYPSDRYGFAWSRIAEKLTSAELQHLKLHYATMIGSGQYGDPRRYGAEAHYLIRRIRWIDAQLYKRTQNPNFEPRARWATDAEADAFVGQRATWLRKRHLSDVDVAPSLSSAEERQAMIALAQAVDSLPSMAGLRVHLLDEDGRPVEYDAASDRLTLRRNWGEAHAALVEALAERSHLVEGNDETALDQVKARLSLLKEQPRELPSPGQAPSPAARLVSDTPEHAARLSNAPKAEPQPGRSFTLDALTVIDPDSRLSGSSVVQQRLNDTIQALTWRDATSPIPVRPAQALQAFIDAIPPSSLPGTVTRVAVNGLIDSPDGNQFAVYGIAFTNNRDGSETRLHLLHTDQEILPLNVEHTPPAREHPTAIEPTTDAPQQASMRTWEPGALDELQAAMRAHGMGLRASELVQRVSRRLDTLAWIPADQPLPRHVAEPVQAFVDQIPVESRPGQLQTVAFDADQDPSRTPAFYALSFQANDGQETRIYLLHHNASIITLCLDVIAPPPPSQRHAAPRPQDQLPARWPTTGATPPQPAARTPQRPPHSAPSFTRRQPVSPR